MNTVPYTPVPDPVQEEFDKAQLTYRLKRFAVKAEPSRHNDNEIVLSVTQNGFQWSSISLLPHELWTVIGALKAAATSGSSIKNPATLAARAAQKRKRTP